MAISQFNVRSEYVGTGSNKDYTFDFKIASLEHIKILVVSDLYVETFNVRGSDVTYLTGVDFDPIDGGGTIHLTSNLPSGHFLTILLANDEVLQEYEFKNKSDFTIKRFEEALDVVTGAVQRLSYLVARSFKLSDVLKDSQPFDVELPINNTTIGTEDNTNKVLAVGPDNKSLVLGPSIVSLAAQAAAAAASAVTAQDVADAANNDAALALSYKTAASASATAASNSASTALGAASSASADAASALAYKIAAAASAAAALVSQNAAAFSAAAASVSETNALASENNALNSENNAATSETNAANSASAALQSEINAAASEAAAAISASVAGFTLVGTRAVPTVITAAGGINFTSSTYNTLNFIVGTGATTVTKNPRIQAGTLVGQRLKLIGRDDTAVVRLADGNGIVTGGLTLNIAQNSVVDFVWDGAAWVLDATNGLG